MVLSHAAGFAPSTSDRFSRALYASLLHPELPTSSKQALPARSRALAATAPPAQAGPSASSGGYLHAKKTKPRYIA